MRVSEVAVGDVVSHYRIVEFLGGGGMGVVYKAEDLTLGRQVALKFLSPQLTRDLDARQRFLLEARAASILDHPNICTVYEIGESPDGQTWIAMAYYDGETLKKKLSRGPLPIPHAISIARAIADGLSAAHAAGIIHRDIKPANVMITSQGVAKIVDFGVAKLSGQAITRPSAVVGTAAYMSPEQVRGEDVTPASDLWSLGVVLYEMLTGEHPVPGKSDDAMMYAILHSPHPAVSTRRASVSPDLDRLVDKLLEKDPSDRFDSAAAFIAELSHAKQGSSSTAVTRRRFSGTRILRKVPRGMFPSVLVFMALLAVIVGTVLVVDRVSDGRNVATSALSGFPAVKQLAVLPFVSLAADSETERLGAGLAQSVASRVGSDGVHVIFPDASNSIEPDTPLSAVGRRLGVNLVVRSSLMLDADRIRVTYSIVDPRSGRQLTGNSVDGTRRELLAFEDELVTSIRRALGAAPPTPRLSQPGMVTATAQTQYFQAIGYLQRYDDPDSVSRAIALLTNLHDTSGPSALVSAALGRAWLYRFGSTHETKDALTAQGYCDEAIRLDPSLPEVHVTAGEIATRLERFDASIASFRKALQLRPESPEATLGLARALDGAGRESEAEATYKAAIAMRPGYWAGYNKLGAFYHFARRPEEAVMMFQRVTELNPDSTLGYNNLGAELLALRRYDAASEAFRRSIALRPNAAGYSNLGTALYLDGQFQNAVTAYREATNLEPNDYVLWYNLGDAYRAMGDAPRASEAYAESITRAREELKLAPDAVGPLDTLARVLAKRGDLRGANATLSRVREQKPDAADTFFASAMINNIAGNRERALRDLREAVARGYPENWIARDAEFANLRSDPWFAQLKR